MERSGKKKRGGGHNTHKERLPMVPLLHEFNLLSLLGIWGGLTAIHGRAAGPSKMRKKHFFFFFWTPDH